MELSSVCSRSFFWKRISVYWRLLRKVRKRVYIRRVVSTSLAISRSRVFRRFWARENIFKYFWLRQESEKGSMERRTCLQVRFKRLRLRTAERRLVISVRSIWFQETIERATLLRRIESSFSQSFER